MTFLQFTSFVLIHCIGVISPGPGTLAVINSALKMNKSENIKVKTGVASAEWIIIFFTMIGVSQIVQKSFAVYRSVQIIGSLYLFYISYKMILSVYKNSKFSDKNTIDAKFSKDVEKSSNFRLFLFGFFANLTNIKTILFYIALTTEIVTPNMSIYFKIFLFFFMCSSLYFYYSVLSRILIIENVKTRIIKYMNLIDIVFAVFMIFLGIKLLIPN